MNLEDLARETRAASDVLWRAGPERRARWLAEGMARLRDPSTERGMTRRARLPAATGLSPAMVEWGLESTLATCTEAAFLALHARCLAAHPEHGRPPPHRLLVVVLAANVFTAAARGVALPLLLGLPVIAKASSREGVFASLLAEALASRCPELGAACRAVTLPSQDEARTRALLASADLVSAYGSDLTLERIRTQLPPHVALIPHGHGLGAALVGPAALTDEPTAHAVARALALDVSAYDQRGCLSPHVAWVVRGGPVSPARFARLTFEALAELSRSLPRGPLPLTAAGAQLGFRTQAALHGSLLEGEDFAVAHEPSGAARPSPGYRNLLLLELDDERELPHKLGALGPYLKCLGTAGLHSPTELTAPLASICAPRVCEIGQMQTPALDALADGHPPWHGLVGHVAPIIHRP